MRKCECDESRKKSQDGTWLNPKYYNNEQSASKFRIGKGSSAILCLID